MNKASLVLSILLIVAISLAGCAEAPVTDRPVIGTSIMPLAAMVEAIAGDTVDVAVAVPTGSSPTNYQPSPRELTSLSEASHYFSVGTPSDLASTIDRLQDLNDNLTVHRLDDLVQETYPARYFEEGEHQHDDDAEHGHDDDADLEHDDDADHGHDDDADHGHDDDADHGHDDDADHGHDDDADHGHDDDADHGHDDDADHADEEEAHDHEQGQKDPHIWLSPRRAMLMVDEIARVLSEVAPEHAERYAENAASFREELESIDERIRARLEEVENKTFIMYHPSLGYFADDYGLEMLAIEAGGKEATVNQLKDVIDFALANDIRVIFYQDEITSKQAETIAESIDGETVAVSPLSGDYLANLEKIASTLEEHLR